MKIYRSASPAEKRIAFCRKGNGDVLFLGTTQEPIAVLRFRLKQEVQDARAIAFFKGGDFVAIDELPHYTRKLVEFAVMVPQEEAQVFAPEGGDEHAQILMKLLSFIYSKL